MSNRQSWHCSLFPFSLIIKCKHFGWILETSPHGRWWNGGVTFHHPPKGRSWLQILYLEVENPVGFMTVAIVGNDGWYLGYKSQIICLEDDCKINTSRQLCFLSTGLKGENASHVFCWVKQWYWGRMSQPCGFHLWRIETVCFLKTNQLKASSKYSSAKVVQLGTSFIYSDEYRLTSSVCATLLKRLSCSV